MHIVFLVDFLFSYFRVKVFLQGDSQVSHFPSNWGFNKSADYSQKN